MKSLTDVDDDGDDDDDNSNDNDDDEIDDGIVSGWTVHDIVSNNNIVITMTIIVDFE